LLKSRSETKLFYKKWVGKKCFGETRKIDGFTALCNNIWIHPTTGEKYPQVFSLVSERIERAIDIAAEDRLKELEWKEIIIRIYNGDDAIESRWWVHPDTKRLYKHNDAVKMAKDYYNNETIFCLLTNKINKLLDGGLLTQGELVCIDFANGIYSVW
jgi:hypothetical protein